MASFRIEWRKSTRKDLRKLPRLRRGRLLPKSSCWPSNLFLHGVEKLADSEHAYRIRVGDYRVIYEVLVEAKLIEIQRVRHRKDVYRP